MKSLPNGRNELWLQQAAAPAVCHFKRTQVAISFRRQAIILQTQASMGNADLRYNSK